VRAPSQLTSDPAVLVDDLVVRFGDICAVGGVSFAVSPAEVFALLGPNGAGKAIL
jgi:ABC-type branched-subunit amino acid transport system ATPase component